LRRGAPCVAPVDELLHDELGEGGAVARDAEAAHEGLEELVVDVRDRGVHERAEHDGAAQPLGVETGGLVGAAGRARLRDEVARAPEDAARRHLRRDGKLREGRLVPTHRDPEPGHHHDRRPRRVRTGRQLR